MAYQQGTSDFFGSSGSGTSGDPVIPQVASTPTASEVHVGEISTPGDLIAITATLDTNAYASGDLIAETQAITNAMRVVGGRGILQSLMLFDQDDQGAALTLYILGSNVTMGTENSAPSISDANALAILGLIDIATTDYKDLGGVKVASVKNIGIYCESAADSRDLYFAIVNSTGTPTYSAGGLKLAFGFLQD